MVVAHTPMVGQWAKKAARDAHLRQFRILFVVMGILAVAVGLLIGLFLSGRVLTLGAALVVALLTGATMLGLRQLDRVLTAGARRRIALLRGAQAEAYVSLTLRDGVDDDWHLFDNVMLDANSDVDHVLIGPGGVLVVSTKSGRGLFRGGDDEGSATFNGRPCDWPRDATRQALRLRDKLSVFEPSAPPWFQAVLALPHAAVEGKSLPLVDGALFAPIVCGSVWVANEEALDEMARVRPERRRRLSKADVQRWVTAVEKLVALHAQPAKAAATAMPAGGATSPAPRS